MKFCKRKETSKGVRASRNVFHKYSVVLWSSCRSLQSETIKKTLILRFRIFFASRLVNCVFRGAPSQRLTGRTLSEMSCNFFSDFAKFSQEEWLRWAILKAGQRSQKLLLLVMPILLHFLEDTKGEKIKRKAQSFKRHSNARTKSDQKLGKKAWPKDGSRVESIYGALKQGRELKHKLLFQYLNRRRVFFKLFQQQRQHQYLPG